MYKKQIYKVILKKCLCIFICNIKLSKSKVIIIYFSFIYRNKQNILINLFTVYILLMSTISIITSYYLIKNNCI